MTTSPPNWPIGTSPARKQLRDRPRDAELLGRYRPETVRLFLPDGAALRLSALATGEPVARAVTVTVGWALPEVAFERGSDRTCHQRSISVMVSPRSRASRPPASARAGRRLGITRFVEGAAGDRGRRLWMRVPGARPAHRVHPGRRNEQLAVAAPTRRISRPPCTWTRTRSPSVSSALVAYNVPLFLRDPDRSHASSVIRTGRQIIFGGRRTPRRVRKGTVAPGHRVRHNNREHRVVSLRTST